MKIRKNQQIPEEVRQAFDAIAGEPIEARDAYMRMLRAHGWTLQSISEAVGDIGRERVRQCVSSIGFNDALSTVEALRARGIEMPLPSVPDAPPPPIRPVRVRPMPSESDLQRLRELKPLAANVRYSHTRGRSEAEEYVSLLWKVHNEDGVSVYRLGKLLDILPSAIESRFVRYGLKETGGSSANYEPIKYRGVK